MMRRKVRGVGIDILDIDRIRKACEQHGVRFLEKIFTQEEISYCQKHKDPYPRFAARFCAKEAVAKALGVGIGAHLSFHDIEIYHNKEGRPEVKLSDRAHRFFKRPRLHLSLSHSAHQATAMVVVD